MRLLLLRRAACAVYLLIVCITSFSFACTTTHPARDRVLVAPLPAPPPMRGRGGVHVQTTLATAARGELGQSTAQSFSSGAGGYIAVHPHIRVRAHFLWGHGADRSNASDDAPNGSPFIFGGGVLFQSPRVLERLEFFVGVDPLLALVPTNGERCTSSLFPSFGDPSCEADTWRGLRAHLHAEVGARIWLNAESLALTLSGHASNTPLLGIESSGRGFAGITAFHLQWTPVPPLELNAGAGLRFGGPKTGIDGVGFQALFAMRLNFGQALTSTPQPISLSLDPTKGPNR